MALNEWDDGAWGATDSPTTQSRVLAQPRDARLAKTVM